MKNLTYLFLIAFLSFYNSISAQSILITDSLQVIDGAVNGHILQSDATGIASWVNPLTIGDNLGNHTALTNLNMNGNNIDFVNQISFVGGGGGGGTTLSEVPGGVGPEVILAPVPFGIGGPVNPPAAPPVVSVIGNAGGIAPFPPLFMLGVHGEAWATNWWATSDKRYKKNIKTAKNGLEMVNKLNPVSYEMRTEEFKEMNFSQKPTYGFLAQELETVIPEAVRINHDGKYLVNYLAVIPVLTQSIKELNDNMENGSTSYFELLTKENKELKQEVNQLKEENKAILERLEKIENSLKQ